MNQQELILLAHETKLPSLLLQGLKAQKILFLLHWLAVLLTTEKRAARERKVARRLGRQQAQWGQKGAE